MGRRRLLGIQIIRGISLLTLGLVAVEESLFPAEFILFHFLSGYYKSVPEGGDQGRKSWHL